MHGAEKLLENSRLKNRLQKKFTSAAAKYVPSSLNEIQLGTELESAKFAKSSFNPNVDSPKNKSSVSGESAEQESSDVGVGSMTPAPPRDEDQKSSKDKNGPQVSEIAMAMVLTNTYFLFIFSIYLLLLLTLCPKNGFFLKMMFRYFCMNNGCFVTKKKNEFFSVLL